MKKQDPAIVKLVNRFDQELKNRLEADMKMVQRIKYNIIGRINPEANITRLSIA
jgi:hypothetical protein